MMNIRYALLDPTGNVTVLVQTPVPAADQPAVAARLAVRLAVRLMELEPAAEQVGFLTTEGDSLRLRMAGGEFCGNAAMSAAALFAVDRGILGGVLRDGTTIFVSVSGAADPVEVKLCACPEEDAVRGTVHMPKPVSVGEEVFPDGSVRPVVRFAGICHVIAESGLSREDAEAVISDWCRFLRTDAAGIMLLDRDRGTLDPLVYVPAAGTLCWEHSCASGTTAVGAYLAAKDGPVSLSLKQPGGTLTVEADRAGELYLTGKVRLIRRQSLEIAL